MIKELVLAGAMALGLQNTYSQENCKETNEPNLEELMNLPAKEDISKFELTNKYNIKKAQIENKHANFQEEYARLETEEQQDSLELVAKNYLTNQLLGEILPTWEGTDWYQEGKTIKPRIGGIACGWLIQRMMQDLDFKFQQKKFPININSREIRPEFAQNWPEVSISGYDKENYQIIEKDTTKEDQFENLNEGIYLIGFSTESNEKGSHIGLLVKTKNNNYLVQSFGSVRKELFVKGMPEKENDKYRKELFKNTQKYFISNLLNENVVESWLGKEGNIESIIYWANNN